MRDLNWLTLLSLILCIGAILVTVLLKNWDLLSIVIVLSAIAIAILAHADTNRG
jgi:hypothetical protein